MITFPTILDFAVWLIVPYLLGKVAIGFYEARRPEGKKRLTYEDREFVVFCFALLVGAGRIVVWCIRNKV